MMIAESAAHVLVADIEAPALTAETEHHLRRVLRLRPGAAVTVTDGAGRWRPCALTSTTVEVDGAVETVPRPTPALAVAFALTKGTKPELVIQKLAELGVDRVLPFIADRSVVRWTPDKTVRQHERWRAVARGALEQSRGCWLSEIAPVDRLADVVAAGAVPADRGGRAMTADDHAVAVGPEGGWSAEERDQLGQPVGLGPTVLRAETAAIAAGVLLTARRSGAIR